ncbi:MAG: hypothetical protein LC772_09270 [Chloroflexi bacterium]|nr:hypothetical protein [Chloroflexota bacterium]
MRNRYIEAFMESHNVIGLATVASVSAALMNPLPLLVGVVAETAYLLFVSDSRWYALRLAKRYDAEVEQRRAQLKSQVLPTLRPEMAERFERLENIRQQIGSQGNEEWVREVTRKLDYLLEKFLQFASKDLQFRVYLGSVLEAERSAGQRSAEGRSGGSAGITLDPRYDVTLSKRGVRRSPLVPDQGGERTPGGSRRVGPTFPVASPQRPAAPAGDDSWAQAAVTEIHEQYQREIDRVTVLLKQETDLNTKAVLEKRVVVLQRRQEFVNKIGRILSNLSHQLELLEDTFGLISDEIQARSPEQVLADIDDVVSQTNTMTQLLEEMAPFEQSLAS